MHLKHHGLKRIEVLDNQKFDHILKACSGNDGKCLAEKYLKEIGVLDASERLLDIVLTGGLQGRVYIG